MPNRMPNKLNIWANGLTLSVAMWKISINQKVVLFQPPPYPKMISSKGCRNMAELWTLKNAFFSIIICELMFKTMTKFPIFTEFWTTLNVPTWCDWRAGEGFQFGDGLHLIFAPQPSIHEVLVLPHGNSPPVKGKFTITKTAETHAAWTLGDSPGFHGWNRLDISPKRPPSVWHLTCECQTWESSSNKNKERYNDIFCAKKTTKSNKFNPFLGYLHFFWEKFTKSSSGLCEFRPSVQVLHCEGGTGP